MKKVLLIAAVAAFAMTSCKKDYTCTCTWSDTAPGSVSTTSKVTLKDTNKRGAKANCVSWSSEYTAGGTTYVQSADCSF